MGLIEAIRSFYSIPTPAAAQRSLWPYVNFDGITYPIGPLQQTLTGNREEISSDFAGLVRGAYQANGIVFACMLARLSLFSEARFMYRQLRSGRPGELFSQPSLDILAHPWPGGTTGDLLARAITDIDLAGNAFFVRRPDRIKRLRPDWVTIVLGSPNYSPALAGDMDAEVIGYIYHPGGHYSGREVVSLDRAEVAHFAPTPDPLATYRGMSWLTPLIREITADSAATSHKLAFFENGATPNMVVSLDPAIGKQAFNDWVDAFKTKHEGVANAYRTLYLGAGAKVEVVGSNLQQIDFKVTQGAGETRIAAAAGVPPVVVGLSEGLQGSSLNAGNFAASMRRFADITMRPLWRNIAGSLATIVPPPSASELWYDDRDIPALKDDIADAAQVQSLNAASIRQLIDAGFEPDSVVAAITAGDWKQLKHTGLAPVQVQPAAPAEPDAEDEEEPAEAEDDGAAEDE